MKNKEIQEKRMRGYFIQATKDILKGEGISSINVRNIADQAGYSYATLYNYFKDVNELVFLCVIDFQEECSKFVKKQTINVPEGKEKLKASVQSYINYFVEYPGIFDLYFLTKVGDFGNKTTITGVINTSLDKVCEEDWNYCMSHKLYKIKEVESLKAQLRYSVIGLLILFLNRMTPPDYSDFINQSKLIIDSLLE